MSRNDPPDRRSAGSGSTHEPRKQSTTTGRPSDRQGPERIARMKEEQAVADRSRRSRCRAVGTLAVIVAVIVAVIMIMTATTSTRAQSPTTGLPGVPGPIGPEHVPIEQGPVLAPASSAATGGTVDGVECNSSEQLASHVHTHLSVYVDGVLRPVPAGIGVVSPVVEQTPAGAFDSASQCFYWLHVHAQDGVIHVESPAGHTYVLGQFFDLWGQPLGPDRVGPVTGHLTLWVDGRRYLGDPRSIPLGSHEDVPIDVGRPVVGPHAVRWSATSL
jgi:hypothetical protein